MEQKGLTYVETTDLEAVMPELDILYMTRVQRERFFNEEDYCKNPRCITTAESQLDAIFLLSDAEKRTYRCAYCEAESSRKKF